MSTRDQDNWPRCGPGLGVLFASGTYYPARHVYLARALTLFKFNFILEWLRWWAPFFWQASSSAPACTVTTRPTASTVQPLFIILELSSIATRASDVVTAFFCDGITHSLDRLLLGTLDTPFQ